MGVPEIAEAVKQGSPTTDFEVWEDNWSAVLMFMKLQTQWITNVGSIVGLNYQSVEFLFRIEGIENQREMFADLQLMEAAALGVMNSKD